ncbi:phospholipase domain-containing protein [Pedobacter sp. NJ-S-72]
MIKQGVYTTSSDRPQQIQLKPQKKESVVLNLSKYSGWYDFTIQAGDETYSRQYAGHVETGEESISDPYMGGIL